MLWIKKWMNSSSFSLPAFHNFWGFFFTNFWGISDPTVYILPQCTSRLVWYCSSISRAAKRQILYESRSHVTNAFNLFNRAPLQNLIRNFITLIFEVLLMLSQHFFHNSLICIISDKGVHNDSHYTDMTGEFRFLSAPPLLRDSSSHDYNDYMMMMLTCTVTSESHEGTHRGIYSINNDWIYFQKRTEILWISEWYLHVVGTVRVFYLLRCCLVWPCPPGQESLDAMTHTRHLILEK